MTGKGLLPPPSMLSAFYAAVPDAVLFVDPEGGIVHANPAACRLVGYGLDELQRSQVSGLFRPQDVPRVLGKVAKQDKGSNICGEYRLSRSDGTVLWVDVCAFAFPPEYQGLMGLVLRDITARKEVEADIVTRTKLEAVSTLAGGIAHDWNNILSIILGNLDLAKTRCPPEDPMTPMLQSAHRAAMEARELVFKFLCFARSAMQEVTTVHPGSLAEEACRATLAGKPVTGQVSVENGVWSLKGDPQLLRTVLVNILENARTASPVGGRIQVRIRNVQVDPQDALCRHVKPGSYIRLDIQDEGPGIPADILERVFDPYFSTKPRGTQKGMGMGLSVAWGIVQSHGGHIAVTSQEQGGTTVTLYLPAVPEARSLKAALAEMEGPLRAKILVMDDEPMLRQLAEAVMEHLGYQCETARHGKEAVAKYKEAMDKGEPFDMVILDLTVKGGMGGIPTMAQLLTVDPHVKAVIYTGYSADPILENYRLYGFQGALPKPYAIKDMADMIRRVLGKKEH
ncbi:hybrid sensor histidine kinase/response regulator [Desulfosoma sp.]